MTPKEKAEELVKKMLGKSPNVQDGITRTEYIILKGCALIAVEEIIKANPHSNPLNTDVYSTMDYWEQVKQEINNL